MVWHYGLCLNYILATMRRHEIRDIGCLHPFLIRPPDQGVLGCCQKRPLSEMVTDGWLICAKLYCVLACPGHICPREGIGHGNLFLKQTWLWTPRPPDRLRPWLRTVRTVLRAEHWHLLAAEKAIDHNWSHFRNSSTPAKNEDKCGKWNLESQTGRLNSPWPTIQHVEEKYAVQWCRVGLIYQLLFYMG